MAYSSLIIAVWQQIIVPLFFGEINVLKDLEMVGESKNHKIGSIKNSNTGTFIFFFSNYLLVFCT
jgi:hypothetical protein